MFLAEGLNHKFALRFAKKRTCPSNARWSWLWDAPEENETSQTWLPFTGLSGSISEVSPLKVMVSPLKVMVSPLKVTVSPLKVMVSPLKVMVSPLKVTVSPLKVTVSPLKVMVSPLKVMVSPLKWWFPPWRWWFPPWRWWFPPWRWWFPPWRWWFPPWSDGFPLEGDGFPLEGDGFPLEGDGSPLKVMVCLPARQKLGFLEDIWWRTSWTESLGLVVVSQFWGLLGGVDEWHSCGYMYTYGHADNVCIIYIYIYVHTSWFFVLFRCSGFSQTNPVNSMGSFSKIRLQN